MDLKHVTVSSLLDNLVSLSLLLRRQATSNAPYIEADLDEGYDNISNLFSTSCWTLYQCVSTVEISRWNPNTAADAGRTFGQ